MEICKHTGADYEYDYHQLYGVPENVLEQFCKSLRSRFRIQSAIPESREEWIARSDIAVKYLLATSVMLTSAEYVSEHNVRMAEPYLLYYGLFNTSRALFLMIPEHPWKDGQILKEVTHTKIQNVITDLLRRVSQPVSEQYLKISRRALATREALSYSFPAQGLKGALSSIAVDLQETVDICQFIAEVAQASSECLEAEFSKLPEIDWSDHSEALSKFYFYELRTLDEQLIDDEDYYRLGQFIRHSSKPWSLHKTGREGLVEDFFGAWFSETQEQNPDAYNPDDNWRIIFDFQ